jgi:anionic cell wall polymer biosynthesis LytR-Cps2A-Psr (LCP) family protein
MFKSIAALELNTAAFREIVDLLGGVEINVPKRMQYHDSTQSQHRFLSRLANLEW